MAKRYFMFAMSLWFLMACQNRPLSTMDKADDPEIPDSIDHGYNELANPKNKDQFTISDFNTDNTEIENIDRPKKSTIHTKLDTNLLFNIWTEDPDGPHADFVISGKNFYVVDYDGDGHMPYELNGSNLKIYYNDFIQEGKIVSVNKDTLRISWEDFDEINNYVKWTQ